MWLPRCQHLPKFTVCELHHYTMKMSMLSIHYEVESQGSRSDRERQSEQNGKKVDTGMCIICKEANYCLVT